MANRKGELSVHELAHLVGRDVKRVREDVGIFDWPMVSMSICCERIPQVSNSRYNVSQSMKQEVLMAATTTMVHVRVDEKIKAQAAETLSSMGLTVSDAVRVFLTRIVADKELPFALKAPNESSRLAIAEGDQIVQSRRARFITADALLNGLEEASRK